MIRQRRAGGGGLRILVVLVLVLVLVLAIAAVFVIDYGGDALLFAPWAYSLFGPTLTGDWTGTVRSHSGTEYAIYLHIDRSRTAYGTFENSHLTGNAYIDGHASWCAHGMPSTTATHTGTASRSASDVRFDVGLNPKPQPRPGFQPYEFRGTFHGSTLVFHLNFRLFRNDAYVYGSFPDELKPVKLAMRKKGLDAYRAACARL
jgi:hypothetical protein